MGLVFIAILEHRLKRLMRGKQGADLEETITTLINELDNIHKNIDEIEEYLADVERRLRRNIQGVRTIRFNPFPDHGSNQSFATAFLNEEGDGVVISSLYSRDKVSVYAKPITKHKSEYELSTEEIQAIEEARCRKG